MCKGGNLFGEAENSKYDLTSSYSMPLYSDFLSRSCRLDFQHSRSDIFGSSRSYWQISANRCPFRCHWRRGRQHRDPGKSPCKEDLPSPCFLCIQQIQGYSSCSPKRGVRYLKIFCKITLCLSCKFPLRCQGVQPQ